TIGASYGADSTHTGSSGSTDLTVHKATATVEITWATPQTYNSSTHPATAVVNGVGGDSNLSPAATLEYFSGSTAGTARTGTTTPTRRASDHTIGASYAANSTHTGSSASTDLTVHKATATVEITWATPQTYNSSTHPATAVVNGVGGDSN